MPSVDLQHRGWKVLVDIPILAYKIIDMGLKNPLSEASLLTSDILGLIIHIFVGSPCNYLEERPKKSGFKVTFLGKQLAAMPWKGRKTENS